MQFVKRRRRDAYKRLQRRMQRRESGGVENTVDLDVGRGLDGRSIAAWNTK